MQRLRLRCPCKRLQALRFRWKFAEITAHWKWAQNTEQTELFMSFSMLTIVKIRERLLYVTILIQEDFLWQNNLRCLS